MARRSNVSPAARILVATLAVLMLAAREAISKKTQIISYYLQQESGVNELETVPAARSPVNGTHSGFGESVVYEFVMTQTADPVSNVMGFVRGTAIVVNNSAAATVYMVNNVVHYDYGGVQGTLSQQGEAVFSAPSWELVISGGTGAFRYASGYNLGSSFNSSSRTHIITHYEAHISIGHKF